MRVLLVGILYPALGLRRVVAPEASLRGQAPWRVQWGPFPAPLPEQVRAATELGARLSLLKRDTLGVAVWNPWVGGGRPGWIASAREGGSPLPLLAVALSREGRAWTGLVALLLVAAYLSCVWMLKRIGLGPWPAALGGVAYALAMPVVDHWLDWQGSALALGPLGVALVLVASDSLTRSAACWGAALVVLGSTGSPAAPFVALGVAAATFREPTTKVLYRLLAVALGAVVAGTVLAPRLWLAVAGREDRTAVQPASIESPLPGIKALALAPARFDPEEPADAQRGADGRGYLGLATLALAGLGLAAAPLRQRGLWGGALLGTLVLAWAPTSWLVRIGVTQRPLGALALAVAVLAAFGLDRLTRGLDPRRHALVGVPTVALVAWSLLPVAVRHLPYATPEEGTLTVPLPAAAPAAEPRVLGLYGCLPPDIGAASGLADVRASFFDGEPRYTNQLGSAVSGVCSISRALTPEMAALGAGTLLEPLPLRVVSNEIYSRIEVADVPVVPGPDATLHGALALEPGTCRIGIPAGNSLVAAPVARVGSRSFELAPDEALAAESDEWRWFALPQHEASTAVALVFGAESPGSLPVAVDRSGLRLVGEGSGVRVWSWDRAAAFASLRLPPDDQHPGLDACPGHVAIHAAYPDRVSMAVRDAGSCSLLVQVKFRPALWRATVNGQPAQTFGCSQVWTCVPVPAGDSIVDLRAELPWPLPVLSLVGLVTIAGLAWVGRKR